MSSFFVVWLFVTNINKGYCTHENRDDLHSVAKYMAIVLYMCVIRYRKSIVKPLMK